MTTTAGELTTQDFKTIFRRHTAAVAVITLQGPTGPVGFTATSVISVSAAPPILAFSIDSASTSWPALAQAETAVANLLTQEQAGLASRFATSGIDRFATVDWSIVPSGEPVLHHTRAWVRGRIIDRFPAGHSHLVVLHALEHHQERREEPALLYQDRGYHQPGPPISSPS
ncbi:flavin reductase family protein [Georgenia wangjunii]|uniref:flavin reductase family protein n=1 Tax=Georgenia wangjunii TaxID=3117730 RepID=UPI002F264007